MIFSDLVQASVASGKVGSWGSGHPNGIIPCLPV